MSLPPPPPPPLPPLPSSPLPPWPPRCLPPPPSALRLPRAAPLGRRHRRVALLPRRRLPPPRAILDESKTDVVLEPTIERSESDRLVDKMDFGQLCDDFLCNSSPSIEATARQLARDILELRQENRAFGCFSISVKYKDPVRSFIGREKYKRPLWTIDAFENPKVTVQEMLMLSTSVLNIKWTVRGKVRNLAFLDLVVRVNSRFTMNQISGQVIEHEEAWDPSLSSPLAQTYFWITRRLFSAVESGKDSVDSVKTTSLFSSEEDSQEIYLDSLVDPTKFFEGDDANFQGDVYQILLVLASIYFVVQLLLKIL